MISCEPRLAVFCGVKACDRPCLDSLRGLFESVVALVVCLPDVTEAVVEDPAIVGSAGKLG